MQPHSTESAPRPRPQAQQRQVALRQTSKLRLLTLTESEKAVLAPLPANILQMADDPVKRAEGLAYLQKRIRSLPVMRAILEKNVTIVLRKLKANQTVLKDHLEKSGASASTSTKALVGIPRRLMNERQELLNQKDYFTQLWKRCCKIRVDVIGVATQLDPGHRHFIWIELQAQTNIELEARGLRNVNEAKTIIQRLLDRLHGVSKFLHDQALSFDRITQLKACRERDLLQKFIDNSIRFFIYSSLKKVPVDAHVKVLREKANELMAQCDREGLGKKPPGPNSAVKGHIEPAQSTPTTPSPEHQKSSSPPSRRDGKQKQHGQPAAVNEPDSDEEENVQWDTIYARAPQPQPQPQHSGTAEEKITLNIQWSPKSSRKAVQRERMWQKEREHSKNPRAHLFDVQRRASQGLDAEVQEEAQLTLEKAFRPRVKKISSLFWEAPDPLKYQPPPPPPAGGADHHTLFEMKQMAALAEMKRDVGERAKKRSSENRKKRTEKAKEEKARRERKSQEKRQALLQKARNRSTVSSFSSSSSSGETAVSSQPKDVPSQPNDVPSQPEAPTQHLGRKKSSTRGEHCCLRRDRMCMLNPAVYPTKPQNGNRNRGKRSLARQVKNEHARLRNSQPQRAATSLPSLNGQEMPAADVLPRPDYMEVCARA